MAGNAKDLVIRLLVDDDQMSKITTAGDKIKNNLGGSALRGATVGSIAVLGGLAAGTVEAAKAAAEAQESSTALQFALDKFPATADTNAEKLYKLNSALALKSVYDDDAIASGQAVLAQFGLTGAQLEQITPLLVDYAAKTGQDMPSAADALGKAVLGQGRALKEIGIEFKDTGDKTGNFTELVGGLTDKVGGFAAVQAGDAASGAKVFANASGELWEALGKDLLPAVTDITGGLIEFVGWVTANAEVIKPLAIGVGILAGAVLVAVGAYKAFELVQGIGAMIALISGAQTVATVATEGNTVAVAANSVAWYASPVTWIIIAIVAAVALLVLAGIWLVQNWDGVVKWFGEAWTNIQNGAAAFFKWVADAFLNFTPLGFIIKNWGAISDWFGKWWDGVLDGVNNAVGWIGDRVGDFVGLFTSIPDRVGDAWNGLVGLVRDVMLNITRFAVDAWNNTLGGLSVDLPWFLGGAHITFPTLNMPALAAGGIVTSPTIALIGEAGPEAVVPLSQASGYGFGGGGGGGETVVVVNLDGREIARSTRKHNANDDW